MKFKSATEFSHQQPDKIGVLMINLGTPDAPTAAALRPYLREFLSDPRVVEIPRFIWMLILHLIILPFRAPKSARAYQSIWTERGSPLMSISLQQRDALREKLAHLYGDEVVVELAMRYNKPSISSVIDALQAQGVRKLVVLPMYPQYAASTVGSCFDAVSSALQKHRWIPDLRFITHYHKHDGYISALAGSVQSHWKRHGKQHLLMSFHGIPKRSLDLGDPYFCECHATARLLAQRLDLERHEFTVSFQSRFGKAEWLQPYTDVSLKSLPAQGVKDVNVVCPGFAADCLETLEEIAEENRGYFLEAGGDSFHYIGALNDQRAHIDALSSLIADEIGSWADRPTDATLRSSLAKKMGAN